MKRSGIFLAAVLVTGIISMIIPEQRVYSVEPDKSKAMVIKRDNGAVHQVEAGIDADRDKIIQESRAIKEDRRKLKEAQEMPDKVHATQVKEEMSQDIKNREAAIQVLKKDIRDKKENRYYLMNGRQKDEPRRTREEAK